MDAVEKLRFFLRMNDITQKDFALKIDYSQQMLGFFLSKKRNAGKKLAKAIAIGTENFVTEKEIMACKIKEENNGNT